MKCNLKIASMYISVICLLFVFVSCVQRNEPQSISAQVSSAASKASAASDMTEDENTHSILGMATVTTSNLSLYEKQDMQSNVLTKLPNEIGVPFYYIDGEWAYIEYNEITGWTCVGDLELVNSDQILISANQAKDIVRKKIELNDDDKLLFTNVYLRQQLGGKITWYVEFEDDKNAGWYLVSANDGAIYAEDKKGK